MKRKEKKKILLFLISIFVAFVLQSIYECYGEDMKVLKKTDKKGVIEAEGKLMWIRMTNFPNNPWKELALVDEKKAIISILIGKKTEEILDKEGEEIRVKGLLKPKLRVKNKNVPVIEIKEIHFLTK